MKANPSSCYSIFAIGLMDNIILGCLSAFWKNEPCKGASPKLLLNPLCSCSAAGDNGFFIAEGQ